MPLKYPKTARQAMLMDEPNRVPHGPKRLGKPHKVPEKRKSMPAPTLSAKRSMTESITF